MNGRLKIERKYYKTLKTFDDIKARQESTPYFDVALEELNVRSSIESGTLSNIPEEGPLIVLANHPFGILDGLITGSVLHRRRKDFYILANHALQKAEPMKKWLIPLDDSGTKEAEAANRPSIIQSMRHLHKGGALCVFPAGRVARPARWKSRIEDYEWQEFAARMILSARKSGTNIRILPLYFDGQNSFVFHLAYILRFQAMRRALILSEALKKESETINVHIGKTTPISDLPDTKNARELTEYLRSMVFDLQPAPVYWPESYSPQAIKSVELEKSY